jgi:hypothetical protein
VQFKSIECRQISQDLLNSCFQTLFVELVLNLSQMSCIRSPIPDLGTLRGEATIIPISSGGGADDFVNRLRPGVPAPGISHRFEQPALRES